VANSSISGQRAVLVPLFRSPAAAPDAGDNMQWQTIAAAKAKVAQFK
jgi:hypothetical protein